MTTKSAAAGYWVKLVDIVNNRSNPILVKEIRQSIHSNIFIVMFMFVLLVNIIICLVGTVQNMPIGPETSFGKEMFIGLCAAYAFVGFLFMPLSAMKEMERERKSYTFEMLRITNLSTCRIVNGKLFSSYVQLMLYMSAFFPFMMFTFLARGITIFQIIAGFLYISLITLWMVLVGIVIGTISQSRFMRAIGALIGLFIFIVGGANAFWRLVAMDFFATVRGSEFLMVIATGAVHYVFAFIVLYLAAVNQLSPYVTNCSRGFRIFSLVYTVLTFVIMYVLTEYVFGIYVPSGFIPRNMWILASMPSCIIWWCIMFLFSTGENLSVPPALKKKIPEKPLFRILFRFLVPGGTRGYILSLVMLVLLTGWAWLLTKYGSFEKHLMRSLVMISAYTVFYVSMGLVICRFLERFTEITPMKRRAASVILVGAVTVFTIVVHLFIVMLTEGSYRYDDYMVFQIFNPITGITKGVREGGVVFYTVICFAGAGVLFNVPWFKRGYLDLQKTIKELDRRKTKADNAEADEVNEFFVAGSDKKLVD